MWSLACARVSIATRRRPCPALARLFPGVRPRHLAISVLLLALGCVDDDSARTAMSGATPSGGKPDGTTEGDDVGVDTRLRVVEIRYLDPTQTTYTFAETQTISDDFVALLGRIDGAPLDPEIVEVYDVPLSKPTAPQWVTAVNEVLEDPCRGNADCQAAHPDATTFCDFLADENIDQVWIWVDPNDPSTAGSPGEEWSVSSDYYRLSEAPAYCDGTRALTVMGLDVTRTPTDALHSFGHLLESVLLSIYPTEEMQRLFFPRCGTVHYTPASGVARDPYPQCRGTSRDPECVYEYVYGHCAKDPVTFTPTEPCEATSDRWFDAVDDLCSDWSSETPAATGTISVDDWSGEQSQYLLWWMSRLPDGTHPAAIDGRTVPSIWEFLTDLDGAYAAYGDEATYWTHPPM
jgi:hypothetical protein